jgi:adenosylmethionine-8-amino-7-oxononanoate aminotransferase
VLEQVAQKESVVARGLEKLSNAPSVQRVRSIGLVGAADLADEAPGYLGGVGWRVYEEARRRGAYLRPLGSTVYICPPLTISESELDQLLAILDESVRAARQ